ncbi:MAG: hypothetical protein IJ446_00960 [Oscillospiraceae bacterium]|nr:hypothetical protein [Oscillospiraceae bacterium]
MNKKLLRLTAALCGISAAAECTFGAFIHDVSAVSISDTDSAEVIIYADETGKKISPYIFGINHKGNISGVRSTVLKQNGDMLSTYNWETNYSNVTEDGVSTNGISLVESFPDTEWNVPALYTDNLITNAFLHNIPVRLVNLQMMGYVANDAMGVVSENDGTDSMRWAEISFAKNDSYLNTPDTSDNVVYIDEYVGYLVNKYGTVAEGGINGFFLDSSPDTWSEKYSYLSEDFSDTDMLINKSAQLSEAVKIMDNNALVFGPSVSGAEACFDFDGTFSVDSISFADYYLSQMKLKSEKSGKRLLDVFDMHFYTEAQDSKGNKIIHRESTTADAYRMQAPRILWDETYDEKSELYTQHEAQLPLLPYLNKSIAENYPDTKLSFSEYSFGGGGNISGCIAQIDALGAFAQNGVYLACLMPDEISDYQKTGINIFTDYDYNGSSVGNIMLNTDNNDNMSSSYAMIEENDNSRVWVILTNKNSSYNKDFSVKLNSETTYLDSHIYRVYDGSPEIIREDDLTGITDNTINITLEPRSVCLLTVYGDRSTVSENVTETSRNNEDMSEIVSEEIAPEIQDPAQVTLDITTDRVTVTTVSDIEISEEAQTSETDVSETTAATEEFETGEKPPKEEKDPVNVPFAVKIIITVMMAGCGCTILYILLFDKR